MSHTKTAAVGFVFLLTMSYPVIAQTMHLTHKVWYWTCSGSRGVPRWDYLQCCDKTFLWDNGAPTSEKISDASCSRSCVFVAFLWRDAFPSGNICPHHQLWGLSFSLQSLLGVLTHACSVFIYRLHDESSLVITIPADNSFGTDYLTDEQLGMSTNDLSSTITSSSMHHQYEEDFSHNSAQVF